MDTHGLRVDFGKQYRGELYTRVPLRFLYWMISVDHKNKDIAKAELDRRGSVTPELLVSHHAVDRASLRLLGLWVSSRLEKEGISSWLHRIAAEALKKGLDEEGKVCSNGIKFAFKPGELPTLRTVMTTNATDDID